MCSQDGEALVFSNFIFLVGMVELRRVVFDFFLFVAHS